MPQPRVALEYIEMYAAVIHNVSRLSTSYDADDFIGTNTLIATIVPDRTPLIDNVDLDTNAPLSILTYCTFAGRTLIFPVSCVTTAETFGL